MASWISMSKPVRVSDSVQGDSARAHDRHVGMNLGKSLHGQWADQDAQPRIDDAAGKNQLDAMAGREEIGHGQRIGDDLRRLGFEVPGCVIGRRAGVDDDGLVGTDEFGAGAANGLLLAN